MSYVGGRPTVITEDTVRKLEQAFRDGLNVSQACYTSCVSTSTYYEHLSKDKDFSDKMGLAQLYTTLKAKNVIVQEINCGNVVASKWWLEHKAKDEFGIKALSDNDSYERELYRQKFEEEDLKLKEILGKMQRLSEEIIPTY